jgi:hypothetical protein
MANQMQTNGNPMANCMRTTSKPMANQWQTNGKHLGNNWQNKSASNLIMCIPSILHFFMFSIYEGPNLIEWWPCAHAEVFDEHDLDESVCTEITLLVLEMSSDHKWTQAGVDDLFHNLAHNILPRHGLRERRTIDPAALARDGPSNVPQSFRDAITKLAGIIKPFKEIHMCKSGCSRWEKDDPETTCPTCNAPRYITHIPIVFPYSQIFSTLQTHLVVALVMYFHVVCI